MVDREKIIKGLKKCIRCECDGCTEKGASQVPWDCPAYDDFVDSALALLKEQEPVEPKQVGSYGKRNWYGVVYVCPYCNAAWMGDRIDTHFCPECGKAVKCGG